MIKACLFDLDGVLVDTARFHFLAWKTIADELGFEFTENDNERLKGISRMESLNILLQIGGLNLPTQTRETLAARKNEKYLTLIEELTPEMILPGAREFLDDLKAHQILIGLGSSSKNAKTILQKLNIASLFDVIIDGTQITYAKPNPEVFTKGAKALKIQPSECIVFEDAEAGVQAALNGGMRCVGIGSPEILRKAHRVVPNLGEMSYQKIMQL
jgi:beta-phosphoglucomutase